MIEIGEINCNKICAVYYEVFDRGKNDLIEKGNLPSIFPNLTYDISKKSELTVIRHSTAKLSNRKIFIEGDKVVVYDNHKMLSCPEVISEILGSNNYLVFYDNSPKNVIVGSTKP